MPLRFDRQLRSIRRVVRFSGNLGVNDTAMVAWWYCGIYKNKASGSQPNVLVAFREISPDGLSDDLILRRVPITTLGQVRLGSVWKKQRCVSEVAFETRTFEISIEPGQWRFVSFRDSFDKRTPPPYPFDVYPLKYSNDKNWLISFELSSGGTLLIPCLEYFARCYGYSAELKRILATYPWCEPHEIYKSRLYAPLDQPEERGKWKVKLRRRMVNSDIIFLAHVKYDKFATRAAKSIYAQIEAMHNANQKAPIFIKIGPWFEGRAQLKVSGISFGNGKSFLGLNILGSSDPEGIPLLRDRENTNKSDGDESQYGEETAWAGVAERRLIKPPEIIDLTGDLDPDSNGEQIEILDPDYEVLGTPRVVVDMHSANGRTASGTKHPGTDTDAYSTGETGGDGKGIGYAAIHAKPVLESQGTLRDVWNAMRYLKEQHPETIRAIEWFTWETGFQNTPEPSLIRLAEFDVDEEIDTEIRNWLYQDVSTRTVRGVLVARLVFDGCWVCILEIQRRHRMKKDNCNNPKSSEESFKGLVCAPPSDGIFNHWLKNTLSSIRRVKGIVQHLETLHIDNCSAFAHSRSSSESVAGEAAVLNALKKVGISLL